MTASEADKTDAGTAAVPAQATAQGARAEAPAREDAVSAAVPAPAQTYDERADGPARQDARGAGRLRALAGRPAIQGAAVLVLFLAIFIIGYAFPLLQHPRNPGVYQSNPDPDFYIWSWRWWPYAIGHGLNPLYTHQAGAPAGYDLSWTTSTPTLAVLLTPITLLLGPVASFNFILAVSAPVSGWVAFLAARRLTGRFWAALAAGIVYGFNWYEVGETAAGHPNLLFIMLLPLTIYLTLLWRDEKLGRGWFVALMAVTMAAEFYTFDETFAELTLLWAFGLVVGFLLARPRDRQWILRLARLVTAAWVIAVAAAAPYVIYALLHFPAGGFTKVTQPDFSLDLKDLVSPWSGIVLLAIAVALAVLFWKHRLARLLAIGLVFILALAIGPVPVIGGREYQPVPWSGLWHLPGARSAEPLRLMIFVSLVLAMMVALWLGLPVRSRVLAALRWVLPLVAIAGIIAYVPTPGHQAAATFTQPTALPRFISAGLYRDYLSPGETVVVVSERGNAGLLFQADSNFYMRIAGGFINRSLNTATGMPAPVEALIHRTPAREQQFRAYVRQAGVGAIIVEQAWSAPWMEVFSKMGLRATAVGGVIIYRTGSSDQAAPAAQGQ